ncbi:hypothetical protein C8T65DRAFT_729140 [Cerioporus squamosus]|nr:hypothetical protein C8T65DRAFT_729140 [Cerioporus squamosus]
MAISCIILRLRMMPVGLYSPYASDPAIPARAWTHANDPQLTLGMETRPPDYKARPAPENILAILPSILSPPSSYSYLALFFVRSICYPLIRSPSFVHLIHLLSSTLSSLASFSSSSTPTIVSCHAPPRSFHLGDMHCCEQLRRSDTRPEFSRSRGRLQDTKWTLRL